MVGKDFAGPATSRSLRYLNGGTPPPFPIEPEHSAQNARKHGLTATELIVHEDEHGEFEELQRDLLAEINPQSARETLAFRQLLHAAWNLQRFRRLEAVLCFDGIDPLQNEATADAVDRLARYAARAERSYYRALNELRTLAAQRQPASPSDPDVANSRRQNEPNRFHHSAPRRSAEAVISSLP